MIIVDKRNKRSHKNSSNRARFINRYKRNIQASIERNMNKKGASIKDSNKSTDVLVDWKINEDTISFDKNSGDREYIISGNKDYSKGDILDKVGTSAGKGGQGENSDDDFLFTLSKEEFFDIYFYDMDLPNFIKESMLDVTKIQYRRAGYIKDGIPARLDILKTLQMSLARRISNKNEDKPPPFLDDVDLRYKHYINKPQPMLKAVMFCLMDVSGSMEEHHKGLSKKFFILLYLFLVKNYEKVEIRFIRYHHTAKDVNEQEFFYGTDTGGTEVLESLKLVNSIIDKDYPLHIYNVYVAHSSDGDFFDDADELLHFLDNILIPKIQYYAYLQVQNRDQYQQFINGDHRLYGLLEAYSFHTGKKLNMDTALADEDIFPVLKNLFTKK